MKGFKDSSGKFRPTGNKTKSSLTKSDVKTKHVRTKQSQEDFVKEIKENQAKSRTLEGVMKEVEAQWKTALNEDEDLPHVDYDVDITHTGSHGTVDSEYFTITAFLRGLGDIEIQEVISNDGWSETGSEEEDNRLDAIYDKYPDEADKAYDIWLADTFEALEDGMYESLWETIKETYRDRDEEVKKKGESTLASQNFRGKK